MKYIQVPKKLKRGDHIRVIAPSRSMGFLADGVRKKATERLESYGFELSFGKHVDETDEFLSSSVDSRVKDLHEAFVDKTVDGVLSVIGGYNSNQMLDYIDYDLLRNNPKILCGFSDITSISNAITTKSNLITYSGPHFSSWAIEKGFGYSIECFERCCMSDRSFALNPSKKWSDDAWYLDQESREFIDNEGYWFIQGGVAEGKTIGSHARSLSALQGTQYWPDLTDSVLFIEETAEVNVQAFDKLLQSYIQLPRFSGVKGILIGRFQKGSSVTKKLLTKAIQSKRELANLTIVANIDFGHTLPTATLPIGGNVVIDSSKKKDLIVFTKH